MNKKRRRNTRKISRTRTERDQAEKEDDIDEKKKKKPSKSQRKDFPLQIIEYQKLRISFNVQLFHRELAIPD